MEWTEGHNMTCTNGAGQSIEINFEDGPSPMQLALQMVGACSLADVVVGLKDRSFTKAWVELDSTRATTSPRVFKTITMVYHVVGDVPLKLLERIVSKSHEKYCSVSHSMDSSIVFDWRVKLNNSEA